MAGMAAQVGGPVEGTPIMGNMPRPGQKNEQSDPRNLMNTYIYDYFMRNNHYRLARSMIDSDVKMNLQPQGTKQSPGSRNVNGDGMETEEKGDLPLPVLPPGQCVENSFLMDWWCQFWDIYSAARGKGTQKSAQYSQHARSLAQMQNEQRSQRMMMNGMNGMNGMNQAQYNNLMRNMPNGVGDPNGLKRAAMNNRNPGGANPMANMNQMKSQAMMGAQMQRDGSGMEMNGQRPQSPGSADNAPSPNKRQRVEGAMNAANMAANGFNEFAQQGQNVQQKSIEVYAQSLGQQQRLALNNTAMSQGMNPGVQGSPLNQPGQGLEGQHDMFAGNPSRGGVPPAPGQGQGNHALQDYQMQLMLLEQQNKKRLLMARQEQDSMSAGPHNQQGGGPGFPPAMSPQGSRAGPSPNPTDQMKRGTPKLNQQGLPGSPMPDAAMQPRGSPAPGMNFDPSQMPPGMPPQYPGFAQMPQNPMMRPPSSHPGGFNGAQVTQQQMELMRQGGMQNGAWRGPGPQGMMGPGQPQQMGGPMNQPQQRGQMPPPPAPPAGEQPRTQEPSPSQPAQAPPTPSQASKPKPTKKGTKDKQKPAKSKGANTGATPATSGEDPPPTPTPSTPITPRHQNSFANGQQAAQQAAQAPPAAPQPPPPMEQPNPAPFGNITDDSNFDLNLDGFGDPGALETFDFDSFLHVNDDPNGFTLGDNFGFGDTAEVGGDL
ncbi:hypothetical protein K491DRAFT_585303 [Lophiostoma macrostomum CBS 122681]|uniref:LisH domain-containing protein n=1 Tax=Lophiostoma macrostomum CBS 122681 TaxID=1314788 RepID=A0A6A6TUD5_9PLEO|nr:hypothetical protein K491DRAFT_585303 [Lophiostoma macrostomum CBS 122681]